ncbi:MAG: ATP-binding cassette domain-containing protein [Pseudomonadota bacterium]|jgi:ATP-binding cassette subfamily C (CFTR/MRP) protein 1
MRIGPNLGLESWIGVPLPSRRVRIVIMFHYGSDLWRARLTFSWVTPLIKKANKTPLVEAALPILPAHLSVTNESEKLYKAIIRHSSKGHLSIGFAIATLYRRELLTVVCLSLVGLVLSLSSPLLLRELLQGLRGDFVYPPWFISLRHSLPEQLHWVSYSLLASLALSCVSLTTIFLVHHLFYILPNLAFRIRAALNAIIFAKALRQERAALQKASSGFIVNLIASDTLKFQILIGFLHSLWHHPLSLIAILFLLYRLVGVASLIGGSTLLLLLLGSTVITRKQGKLRRKLSEVADRRIGLTRESLIHIKAAKLQGWEASLEKKIHDLRQSEIAISRRLIRLSAIFSFSSGSAPAIAMAITSICLVSQGQQLDAATLFPVLTLFMLLRFSLNILPETVYNLMEAHVASRRLYSFLSSPEFTAPHATPSLHCAVKLTGVESSWRPGGITAVKVPNLEIPHGQLVVVVGGVGSGKSGLLLTLLGELPAHLGSVSLGGSIAYVPQLPWITSDSIRNNILFGQELNLQRYQRALSCAGLSVDLATLPHGDATQIGERGINLSGGQRQRVALARALYSDADIFLFDDPLSALDPQVANHVFTQLICEELAEKTRVLISHRVEFAMLADRVLVLENGVIVEDGSPEELKKRESRFAALLKVHAITTPEHICSMTHPTNDEIQSEIENYLPRPDEISKNSIIEVEDRHIGSIHSSTVMSYAQRLAPGLAGLVVAMLFVGRQGAAVGTDLWLTTWASNSGINLASFISGYLFCIALLCIMAYMRTMYILSRGLAAGAESHRCLLRGVLRAPLTFFESNPVGRILNRFSRDLETVELNLPRSIIDAGHCFIETVVVSLVIAIVTPVTLLLMAPLAVTYYSLSLVFRPVSRELQRLSSISLSPIFSLMSECLSGIESLRASSLGSSFNRLFAHALDIHTKCNFIQTATNRWLGIRLETLGSLLICSVGIAASFGWSSSAGIAFSGLALAYASSMTSSMNWAIRSISMVENSLTSFERIERFSSITPERLSGSPAPLEWPSIGTIQFHELSAKYRPHLPLALNGISCSIAAGSRVGVIGRSGSGKSTLILTLLRLVEPCGGRVEIDGIDTSTIPLEQLRSSIAVVPQEPVLFSGSLRESLDPFGEYSDVEIESALDRVELRGFLASLPQGLDSEVREGGFNFSNGQRQLICLARALLRRNRIVILDEATASIDVHTDQIIQRAIRREFTGSTLLVIAHRIGTILDSDYILALQDGRLVEFGAPSQILENPNSLLGRFIDEVQSGVIIGRDT